MSRAIFAMCVTGLALVGLSAPAGAVQWVSNSEGRLIGAEHVPVAGQFYDVQFEFGRCAQMFAECHVACILLPLAPWDAWECGEPVDLTFQFRTRELANAASHALMDRVFVDGAMPYDSVPVLVQACSGSEFIQFCFVMTPYAIADDGANVLVSIAENYPGPGDIPGCNGFPQSEDKVEDGPYTMLSGAGCVGGGHIFAQWHWASEPDTLACLALGILAGGLGMRRR